MKLQKSDYLMLFGITIILLLGIFLIFYYYNYQSNSCMTNPLIYGAREIEKDYNGEFNGIGYISVQNKDVGTFIFNSKSISSIS